MWVGIGVANLIQLYNPEIFIIAVASARRGLVIQHDSPHRNWRGTWCRRGGAIVPAGLGDDAGIFGGAVVGV